MSTLYLVRHGQASFGQANYDKLSETGELQCRLLGEYWVKWGLKIDAIYCGTLERQRRSLFMIREAYERADEDFPEAAELFEFNEYDSARIMTGSIPDLIRDHPEIMELMKKLAPEGKIDLAENKKNFQRVFARVMDLWVSGELNVTGLESWPEFTGRVGRGLDRVMAEQGSGRMVMVMSSGGPISAAVQRALLTPDRVSMELGWPIINSSVTEFRYSGDKFSLISFNAVPHLSSPELVTHR